MSNVYRITREKYLYDLSGGGSAKHGGRWNPKGTFVLYTAANPSLAMLEWLAHVRDCEMDETYYLLTINLPEAPLKKLNLSILPDNWRDSPPPVTLQKIGADILSDEKWMGFEAPSVLMPLDNNLILNTLHPLYHKVEIVEIEQLIPDERLIK